VEGIQQPPGWPRQVQRHLNEALDFKHWLRRMGQGQCELVHTAVAQLRALYMLKWESEPKTRCFFAPMNSS
jgi:hypothetical protein